MELSFIWRNKKVKKKKRWVTWALGKACGLVWWGQQSGWNLSKAWLLSHRVLCDWCLPWGWREVRGNGGQSTSLAQVQSPQNDGAGRWSGQRNQESLNWPLREPTFLSHPYHSCGKSAISPRFKDEKTAAVMGQQRLWGPIPGQCRPGCGPGSPAPGPPLFSMHHWLLLFREAMFPWNTFL